jgi:hypothetical protein
MMEAEEAKESKWIEVAKLRERISELEAENLELLAELKDLRYHCDTSTSKYAADDAVRADALIAKIGVGGGTGTSSSVFGMTAAS